jgi:hypothetical protein
VLTDYFHGDVARMGAALSFVYALGMVVIWMVPPKGQFIES